MPMNTHKKTFAIELIIIWAYVVLVAFSAYGDSPYRLQGPGSIPGVPFCYSPVLNDMDIGVRSNPIFNVSNASRIQLSLPSSRTLWISTILMLTKYSNDSLMAFEALFRENAYLI